MTVYIVQKRHWQYDDYFFVLEDASPTRAFVSSSDAEEFRLECEQKIAWQATSLFVGEEGIHPREDASFFEVIAVELEP